MLINRSEEFIRTDMGQMESFLAKRDVKYRRNFNRYFNNFNRTDDIWTNYSNILSYYTAIDETVGVIPYLNVIRSAIDTTTSKLSQTRVRPFFNPILGTYKTIKTCRNAQIYFDEIYEMQDVYRKSINSITDALLFDMGVIWIDDETKKIQKINPWEFIFDVAEMATGNLTRVELRRKQYPLTALIDILPKGSIYFDRLADTPNFCVDYRIYWDLLGGKQYKFIGNELIQTRKITYKTAPFVWIYYKDPIKGAFSDSMADVLYRIQKMVDDITYKIAVATELSPANLIFVPKNSGVKTSMIGSSKIGEIFEYNLPSTGGNPITVATPPVIDGMYIQLLDYFMSKAYNLVGVSELSAQAKKPSGLNSGVALQTVEDVESERHNVILQNYTRFCRDIAEKVIEIMPDNEEVLPKRRARSAITWKDIKTEREMFNVQYSSASSLSKDPKVKMEQIEKLISMKVIDPSIAATFLEMPDLEGTYSIQTASYDYNEKIIERAIEHGPNPETGQFNFYECTSLQGLLGQSINTLMRLDTNDEKPEVLDRLALLINQIKVMLDEVTEALQPPPAAPPPMQQPQQPM